MTSLLQRESFLQNQNLVGLDCKSSNGASNREFVALLAAKSNSEAL